MAVNPVVVLDIVVDSVVIGTQNHALVTVLCDVFVDVLQVLSNQKPNSSVAPTNECYDRRFVSLKGSASLFESPRERGLSCSMPFSPAVT